MKEIFKTSEKLVVWMHRSRYTQQEVAKELGITRQKLANKIEDNYWSSAELDKLRQLGVE